MEMYLPSFYCFDPFASTVFMYFLISSAVHINCSLHLMTLLDHRDRLAHFIEFI